MSRAATRRGVLVAFGLVLLGACSRPKGDPVEALLHEIAEAAARRDADAVLARLSPAFSGPGGMTAAEVGVELRRHFALYDSIEVGLADFVVERPRMGAATARFRAAVAGKPKAIGGLAGLLPEAERLAFDVTLQESDGAWRVSGATWERLAPAA